MHIASIVLSLFIAVAASFSAMGKLRKDPKVVAIMDHVGVTPKQLPVLAYLEILGALGLLIGLKVHPLGVFSAAALALYFLGAVIAHVRKSDKVADFAPAVFLALLSAVAAYAISQS